MTPEQFQEFEKDLEISCEKFVKKGGKILPGLVFIYKNKCCPLSAVVWNYLNKSGEISAFTYTNYGALLKIQCNKFLTYTRILFIYPSLTAFNMRKFVTGFDEAYANKEFYDNPFFRLGHKFREKYVGKEK